MRRGDVTRRTAAHTAARTGADGTAGARTTRPATLGRLDDSLAARCSLGVAGCRLWESQAAGCEEESRMRTLGRLDDSLAARCSLGVAGCRLWESQAAGDAKRRAG